MKISTKLTGFLLAGGMALSSSAIAQDEVGELAKVNPADATALTRAYLTPLFKGMGLGLNSGWTNTGTTKKLGRFELRFGATAAMPPASDKTFDVTQIGLSSNFRPVSSSNVMSPTIAGAKVDGPEMKYVTTYGGQEYEVTRFKLPQGLDIPMPGIQLQANIGLIKGFEAIIRYSPDIKAGSEFGTVGMKGGAIKFKPVKLISSKLDKALPVDIAMLVGYNSVKYNYDKLNVQPDKDAISDPSKPNQSKDFSNQRLGLEFSGINVEALVSKKLLMFVPFVSVGYVTSNTKVGMYGNYPATTGVVLDPTYNGNAQHLRPTYTTYTDPVSIDEKFISGMKATAGITLNLFVFHIYGSYTLAEYNYLNVGLGLGFGK